ncbi:MAG: SOS response-associated peptidase [Acidobacteriota bacterium]
MCGRYTLTDPGDLLQELQVQDDGGGELPARYNIAPTQSVPAIRQGVDGARRLGFLHWGLIPFWAKDRSIGNRMINARSETAAEKPSFRSAFKSRRCLIPADGFYEWKKVSGGKQPFHIHRPGRRPFVFAGLWERWDKGEAPIESCTVLTTAPNDRVAEVHDRMPVILRDGARDLWLDPDVRDRDLLESVLKSVPEEYLELTPVSRLVNNPRNDVVGCLDPVEL